jgi:hypothetical protein
MAFSLPGRNSLWYNPTSRNVGGHLPTKSAQFFLPVAWKIIDARIAPMPRIYQSWLGNASSALNTMFWGFSSS